MRYFILVVAGVLWYTSVSAVAQESQEAVPDRRALIARMLAEEKAKANRAATTLPAEDAAELKAKLQAILDRQPQTPIQKLLDLDRQYGTHARVQLAAALKDRKDLQEWLAVLPKLAAYASRVGGDAGQGAVASGVGMYHRDLVKLAVDECRRDKMFAADGGMEYFWSLRDCKMDKADRDAIASAARSVLKDGFAQRQYPQRLQEAALLVGLFGADKDKDLLSKAMDLKVKAEIGITTPMALRDAASLALVKMGDVKYKQRFLDSFDKGRAANFLGVIAADYLKGPEWVQPLLKMADDDAVANTWCLEVLWGIAGRPRWPLCAAGPRTTYLVGMSDVAHTVYSDAQVEEVHRWFENNKAPAAPSRDTAATKAPTQPAATQPKRVQRDGDSRFLVEAKVPKVLCDAIYKRVWALTAAAYPTADLEAIKKHLDACREMPTQSFEVTRATGVQWYLKAYDQVGLYFSAKMPFGEDLSVCSDEVPKGMEAKTLPEPLSRTKAEPIAAGVMDRLMKTSEEYRGSKLVPKDTQDAPNLEHHIFEWVRQETDWDEGSTSLYVCVRATDGAIQVRMTQTTPLAAKVQRGEIEKQAGAIPDYDQHNITLEEVRYFTSRTTAWIYSKPPSGARGRDGHVGDSGGSAKYRTVWNADTGAMLYSEALRGGSEKTPFRDKDFYFDTTDENLTARLDRLLAAEADAVTKKSGTASTRPAPRPAK